MVIHILTQTPKIRKAVGPRQSESDRTNLNGMNETETSIDKVALIHQAEDTTNLSQGETICQLSEKDNRTDAITCPEGTDLNGCPPTPSNNTRNSENNSGSDVTGSNENNSMTSPSHTEKTGFN